MLLYLSRLGAGPVHETAGWRELLREVQEPPQRRGDRWHGKPRDVHQLHAVLHLAGHLGAEPRLDPDHRGHHVAGHAVLRRAEKGPHQHDGLETVLGEHHVVSWRVGHDPLAAYPVELGERGEVAYNLPLCGHRDPTIHLV